VKAAKEASAVDALAAIAVEEASAVVVEASAAEDASNTSII
jgi:hypothetical protein